MDFKDYSPAALGRLLGRITDALFAVELGYCEKYEERKNVSGEDDELTEYALVQREAVWGVIEAAGLEDAYVKWKSSIVVAAMRTYKIADRREVTREMIGKQIERYLRDRDRERLEDLKKEMRES